MAPHSDFQLGEWNVQPSRNRIQNEQSVVRLEPKVMQVLLELATHAGQVLSKEELIHRVWPNVYVSDASLTRCISELRHALNDDPHSPHVIETINKQGYRLMLPVRFETVEPPSPAEPEPTIEAEAGAVTPETGTLSAEPTPIPIPTPSGRVSHFSLWVTLGAIVLLSIPGIIWATRSGRTVTFRNFRITPFTTYMGCAQAPSFSPDGTQIAFIWNTNDENPNIYVKMIGNEPPLRITSTPDPKYSPAWSPDGKWIAYVRQSPKTSGIFLVPVTGGEERQIYHLRGAIDSDAPGLSWSPDGKRIVFSDDRSQDSSSAIYSLSLATYEAQQLTHPDATWDGDISPAYSPNGGHIAFVRGADAATRNLYVMNADGSNVRQLTFHQRQKYGLSWTADGKKIVFSCDEGGTASLWQVSAEGGTPERLPFGTDNARQPAVSAAGDRVAYAQGTSIWSILRFDLKNPNAPPVRLSSSMTQDSAPEFSPDDRLIAYQSNRTGAQEIWVSESDGLHPIKLTSFDGPLTGSPNWSPDGRQIAFDSRVDDRSHIFTMSADRRNRRVLTSGSANDIIPSWSADARWIYFGSKRNQRWQIWKVSTSGGEPVQVTKNGGFVAAESSDGKWVYYTKYAMPGLWRQPSGGGEEELAAPGPPVNYWASWRVTRDGIYFVAQDASGWSVRFLANGKTQPVQVMRLTKQPPAFSAISVSHDGRWLLISDATSSAINIQIATAVR